MKSSGYESALTPDFNVKNKIEMAVMGKAFGLKSSNFFCNYND